MLLAELVQSCAAATPVAGALCVGVSVSVWNGGWRAASTRLGGSVGIIGTDDGIRFPAEESAGSHGGKSFDDGAESCV
jgi:hypothetical protein